MDHHQHSFARGRGRSRRQRPHVLRLGRGDQNERPVMVVGAALDLWRDRSAPGAHRSLRAGHAAAPFTHPCLVSLSARHPPSHESTADARCALRQRQDPRRSQRAYFGRQGPA